VSSCADRELWSTQKCELTIDDIRKLQTWRQSCAAYYTSGMAFTHEVFFTHEVLRIEGD